MQRTRIGACALGVLAFAALSLPPGAAAATLPPGFSDDLVVSVDRPTDLAFTPDGRMLITVQHGQLRVVADGALLATAALDLAAEGTVCTNEERGLLGVAVDPGFATNRFIYLYYTFKKSNNCDVNSTTGPVNRVSQFTLSAPPGNTVDPGSEVVLIDNIPSPGGDHNAGDLHVAADGLLYVTVGDGACKIGDATRCAAQNDNSRFLNTLLGKVLRIGLDGTVPSTNPYAGASDARRCGDPAGVPIGAGPCSETFASGLRNPFRFAFRPGTSEFYINDVGQATWEEIDLGLAGADYGWNVREGKCAAGSTSDCDAPPPGMTNPIHVYGHGAGCRSITGGAFVPVGVWPAGFDNAYIFSDWVCGKIFRLIPNGSGGFDQAEFATGLGGVVAMTFGPYGATQALYYVTFAGSGQVRRISGTPSANQVPLANAGTAGTASGVPVAITLTGSDVETCNLTFNAPATTVAGGTLSAPGPLDCVAGSPNTDSASVMYTPPGGFSGPDSFTFTVHDGTDPSTAKTISITVGAAGGTATFGPAADAQVTSSNPNTNYGTLTSIRTREGTGASSNPIYRSYLQFNVAGVSGTVTDVKLRLFVTDASPNLQNVFAVSPDTWIESGAGGITYNTTPATDTPASPLGGAPAPTTGWVEIDLANSAVSANGPLSFALKSAGTNSAIFSSKEGANDPQLVVTFAAGPPNTLPTATGGSPTTTNEDTAQSVTLGGSDQETCNLTFNVPATTAHGTLSVPSAVGCAPGSPNTDTAGVTYMPAANYNGPDSFSYTVTDSAAGTSTPSTVNLTVGAVNDVPLANAGTAGTASGVPVAITLTGSDVETCNLTFNAPATTVAGGTLSAPPGPLACVAGSPNTDSASVMYTPPGGGFSGPDSFTFTVHDGTDPSTPKTISITVGAAGGTATFGPAADAQVTSSNPNTNYGTLTSIRTREGTGASSNPIYRSYLQFNVAGVSGTVSDVKLRLFVTDASPNLQNVFAVSPDTWIESGAGGITYNTTPAIDTPASPLGGAPAPTTGWVEIDLANSAVSANGPLSFALKSAGTNSAIFSSKEGANAPQLVVTFGP